MPIPLPVRRAAVRASIAGAWLALAGCANFHDWAPAPEPIAAPPVEATPQADATLAPAPARAPAPSPKPPAPASRNVVVLFEEGAADYAEVAAQIVAQLPAARYRAVLVPIRADSSAILAPLVALRPSIAVAVGREAVELARKHLATTPLVFCQVFNYQEFLSAGQPVWGVSPIPPLALQLRGWTTIDPSRRRIGLIVSEAQKSLADEAVKAAHGTVAMTYEVSSSDRETLYLFKRLAPQVDGLWLFPDNRILSPNVLRELLSYAVSHGVGVLVFNDSLLQWGALTSASSTVADVARSVRGVLDRVVSGATRDLPAMTPLTEIELQVNLGVARELGVPEAPQSPLVLRERN